jgi:hypothetical protein
MVFSFRMNAPHACVAQLITRGRRSVQWRLDREIRSPHNERALCRAHGQHWPAPVWHAPPAGAQTGRQPPCLMRVSHHHGPTRSPSGQNSATPPEDARQCHGHGGWPAATPAARAQAVHRTRGIDGRNGCIDTRHGLHFGQHDVGRLSRMPGTPDDGCAHLAQRPGGPPRGAARLRDGGHAHQEPATRATSAACSASAPTGAPSSQSSVTSKHARTELVVNSRCSARLLRIRASTPL